MRKGLLKLAMVVLILLDLFLILLLFSPSFYDSMELAKAVAAAQEHPIQENQERLNEIGRKIQRYWLLEDIIVVALIGMNTYGIFRVRKALKKNLSP